MNTTNIHVICELGSILTIIRVRSEHLNMMIMRGWIKENNWVLPGQSVLVMSADHMIEFLNEVK